MKHDVMLTHMMITLLYWYQREIITRIFENIGIRCQAISKKEPTPNFNRRPFYETPDMISKVKQLMDRENPLSHRHIQKETTLVLCYINKIIHLKNSFSLRKPTRPIAASYLRSSCQETNPNLRSLWMMRSFISIKKMGRLKFSMCYAEKPYMMIGYLKKVKVSVRAL